MISNAETEAMRSWLSHLRYLTEQSKNPLVRMFTDVSLVSSWGLPLQGEKILVSENDGAGWAQIHIDHMLSDDAYLKRGDVPANPVDPKAMVAVLSFPGVYTYGHWIIDICARLEILSDFFDLKRLKFAVPSPFPAWAKQFLDVYGIKARQLVYLDNVTPLHVSRLIVPSLGRIADYLPAYPHGQAMARLKAASIDRTGADHTFGRRLLVRHVPMGGQVHRSLLSNFDEIESVLASHGFETIEPATMSRDDQVRAFAGADFVIGEDSSALHNIVYSDPLKIIVFGAKARVNYLHMALADLLGHEILYLPREDSAPGVFECPVRELEEIILAEM